MGYGTLTAGTVGTSTAKISITLASTGTFPITAVFNGSATFAGSTSSPVINQVVNAAVTTTTVTATTATNPLESGSLLTADSSSSPITLSATVAATPNIGIPPTGSVQFGYTTVITQTTSSIATGSQIVTPASMTGIHSGDTLLIDTGTSQETVTVTGVTGTTFTATFTKAHTASASAPVQIADIVSGDLTNLGNAVTLTAGTTTSTATLVVPNTGSNPVSALAAGTYVITASYATGNSSEFSNSNGGSTKFTTVNNTDTVVISSSQTSNSGFTLTSAITLTATVTGSGGGSNPGGSVDFFDGNLKLGTAALSPSTGNTSVATLTLSSGLSGANSNVVAGAQYFGAIYLGDLTTSYAYATSTNSLLDPTTGAPLSTPVSGVAPGDTIVVQVGDGFTNPTAIATLYGVTGPTTDVFLDEYTSFGKLVQRIGLPQEDLSSSIHALSVGEGDIIEGMAQLSTNGLYVTVAGYDLAPFSSGASATNPVAGRTVAQLTLSTGAVDTSTVFSNSIVATREVRDAIETTETVNGTPNVPVIILSGAEFDDRRPVRRTVWGARSGLSGL